MRIHRSGYRSLALTLLALVLLPLPAGADAQIAIMVDGLPLDAKAISVKDEVYVPAWILENYAHTKIRWMRQGNILEILTVKQPEERVDATKEEGRVALKIGFYLESEGFVVGKNTRLFLLSVDPKDFRFPDGKTAAARAHEGAIDRVGNASDAMKEYLTLLPTERFTPKGWRIVAKMPKEEITSLSSAVDKYELLYKSLFYDLLTNLVIEREQDLNASSVIDDSLKGTRIEKVPVAEDGTASIKAPNGIYFLFGRLLHGSRQVVWDLPITVRGGEVAVELSNRNAALMQ